MSGHPVTGFQPPSPRQYPYHARSLDPNSSSHPTNGSTWSSQPPYTPRSSLSPITPPVLYTIPQYAGRSPTQYPYMQSPPPSSEVRPISQDGRNSYFQDAAVPHEYRLSNSPGTSPGQPPNVNITHQNASDPFAPSRSTHYSQSQHYTTPYSPPASPTTHPQEPSPQNESYLRQRTVSYPPPPQIHLQPPAHSATYPVGNAISLRKSHEDLASEIQQFRGLNIGGTSPSKDEKLPPSVLWTSSITFNRPPENLQSNDGSNGHSPPATNIRSPFKNELPLQITVTTWNSIRANFDGIHEKATPIGVGGFARVFEVYLLTLFP